MMDKYGTKQDPTCHPGSTVLKNKLNIKDEEALNIAERSITTSCAKNVAFALPPYDINYLCNIHKTLFCD